MLLKKIMESLTYNTPTHTEFYILIYKYIYSTVNAAMVYLKLFAVLEPA